eukprot:8071535-Karenia_brevis.AAC.1
MIRSRARKGEPCRAVNISDSKVVVYCFAKGRSSSYRLNGLLRRVLGHLVLGRVSFVNLWVRSECNPADDPSRFVRLRAPMAPEKWLSPLLAPQSTLWQIRDRFIPVSSKKVCEVFAGHGALSSAFGRLGFLVETIEAFPPGSKGTVVHHDVSRPEVQTELLRKISNGEFLYIHFGVPCSTWGPAGWLNGGTRRRHQEGGNGSLIREILANDIVQFVAKACKILISLNLYYSIENPHNSFLWTYGPIAELAEES